MAHAACRLIMVTFLAICAASQLIFVVVGSPTPAIKSLESTNVNSPKLVQQQELLQPPKAIDSTGAPKQPFSGNSPMLQAQQFLPQQKVSVAEKLKRGLTNFINQHNPAPFFVPHLAQFAGQPPMQSGASTGAAGKQATKSALSATRDTPTIINDAPSADAVIKGPNRLVQARPLGGPLRWGRR